MIKTLQNTLKQDKEHLTVPKSVQDTIPIRRIWPDGLFQFGGKFSKTIRFSDINYAIASKEDKTSMFLGYSELLNALDTGSTTKITINNKRLNRRNFEQEILIPPQGDHLDGGRSEYNAMLLDKVTDSSNSIVQERYVTVSAHKKTPEDARTFFDRVMNDVTTRLNHLDSHCEELDAVERLRVLHDFYRVGEEARFHIDLRECMKTGRSFKDTICPDSMEFRKDHFIMGDKYGRAMFLKEYASYIKDSMINELTSLNRTMMLSIDVIPVPTDEAVREMQNRLLGVETNVTNWQRRQNSNNNFSAVVPYELEQVRGEAKEFLDELRSFTQVIILSDTFEEFAMPLMKKLGYPTIFCNSLEVAPGGEITGFQMRCEQSKLTTVKALQSIDYDTIAAGDSYNDLGMIQASKAGFLFRSTDAIKAEHPELPAFDRFDDLLAAIRGAMAQ